MLYSFCPKCDQKINIAEDLDIGLHCFCAACLTELVVVWLNPVELMPIDYGEHDEFSGDFYEENFQKIRSNKGENHGNGKTQKKFQENHRKKENF